jgi:acetyl esterase/lipase
MASQRIIYSQGTDGDLYFDFTRPVSKENAPWVLVVHGGGWDSGNPQQLSDLNSHLAHQGYAVAAVSYRLAPRWRWPAQRDDVEAAATYIKAHAKELNIDPTRWALLGRSAGGQISQALAYEKKDPALKGVIAYYTPSDLDFAYRMTKDNDIINSRDLLINLLGGRPDQVPAQYKDASPLNFVTRTSPPTLLIHGRQDSLTWYKHSRRLVDAFNAAGGRAVYIELPWATHAFDFNLNGPGGQVATAAVDIFLKGVFS